MKKTLSLALAALVLSLFQLQASAASDHEQRIRSAFAKIAPQIQIDSISSTPLPGVFQVMFGTEVVYVSGDGKYLMQGKLIDLATRQDIAEAKIAQARLKIVNAFGPDQRIGFGDADSPYKVTVFTDIDCGYCRQLHQGIAEYNQRGIRIEYLFYPRAGIDSESYRKAVSVWCAEDQHQALTEAKQGKTPKAAQCDNPIKAHYVAGEDVGVRGTPTLVLADGRVLPGYVPPERLEALLKQ